MLARLKQYDEKTMSKLVGATGNSILYVVSEDWVFLSHRMPAARAARNAGFDVHVATHVSDGADAIHSHGFKLHPIPLQRGSVSLVSAFSTIRAIRAIERRICPAVVHHSGVQCTIFGSIAALGFKIRQVNALTGLGYVFTSRSIDAIVLKFAISRLLRFFLNRTKSIALVENSDDRTVLQNLGIAKDRIALIPGSGVDTDDFTPMPEPTGVITIGFAGRLLRTKGIIALIAAHQLLVKRGVDVHLLIAGATDPANPASVSEAQAEAWNRRPGVTWLGQIPDIKSLWLRSHIAVLPSHREGLPVSLLEAAACGRPLIATNVPGCREIAIDDLTGLLVPVENPVALAQAIEKLALSSALRTRYGTAARQLVVDKLSAEIVGKAIVELYREPPL